MQQAVFISLLFLIVFARSSLFGGEGNSPSKIKQNPSESTPTSTTEGGQQIPAITYQELLLQPISPVKDSDVPAGYSKEELLRGREVLKKQKARAPITRDGGRSYSTYDGNDAEEYQRNLDRQQDGRVKQLEKEKRNQQNTWPFKDQ